MAPEEMGLLRKGGWAPMPTQSRGHGTLRDGAVPEEASSSHAHAKPWAWHPSQPSSSRRNGHQQRMGAMPTALRGHAGDETAYRELVLAGVLND